MQAIVKYLKSMGCYVLRINSGVIPRGYKNRDGTISKRVIAMAPQGTPDIIGALPNGNMFAVEVKKPSNTLSPRQALTLALMNNHNIKAIKATSVEEVQKAFFPVDISN